MQSVQEVTATMRSKGRRVTPQRQCIVRLLQENYSHPTVESLYEEALGEMPTISLRTVYQTVHDLESLGEVRLLDLGTGSLRVEPNIESPHHHLACTSCGRVVDIPVDFPGLRVPDDYLGGFTVDAAEVVFRGRCEACS